MDKERKSEQQKYIPELVALRFTSDDIARGWYTIEAVINHLYVVKADQDLVYLFSSRHWEEVEKALTENSIPYQYFKNQSIDVRQLKDTTLWQSGGTIHE